MPQPDLLDAQTNGGVHKESEVDRDDEEDAADKRPADLEAALRVEHPLREDEEVVRGQKHCPLVRHLLHAVKTLLVRHHARRQTHQVERRPELRDNLDVALLLEQGEDADHDEAAEEEHGAEAEGLRLLLQSVVLEEAPV